MLTHYFRTRSKQERLWDACSYGRENTVKTLIDAGANLNWKSHVYECYPIHIASQGKPAIVRMLLEAGCQVDSADAKGNTALHHAAMSGRVENVEMLLDAGAAIDACNENNWTPLLNAVYWNHAKVASLLIARGANPLIKNKDGRNALHELCRSKSRDSSGLEEILVSILDRVSACEDQVNSSQPATPWDQVIDCRAERRNSYDFEANFTPLLFACYHGHLALVDTLLRRGADINAKDQNGWTALHWAAQRCHADVVELLLDYGASRSIEDARGDMPCDVTNDLGLRDCLLPDPEYPNIVSNGYVTTDEEDDEDNDGDLHHDHECSPVSRLDDLTSQHRYHTAPRSQPNNVNESIRVSSGTAVPDINSCKTDARINELNELNMLDTEVRKLRLAVFEAAEL
ncbi:putative Ankyrin repeat-containing [Fasciola hepatica]|uniref:Ankyrin repeat-containing n=1 Tax=Fasciola hepatica TaxID=6192 RepID=A0A4E0R1L5_FASHE|nr:putative Ankyrin repeat-containing [Fasciola hepatica]